MKLTRTSWRANVRASAVSNISSELANSLVPFGYNSYEYVDESPGLYCFWVRGTCLYVGMSTNLKRRLQQHCMTEDNPILKDHFRSYSNEIKLSFVYRDVLVDELRRYESQAISKLRPIANRSGNS